uniref:Uncharacterized protein n=1 Tax=Timema tahoe TaxID=61484 RepID=A0A7R9FH11_9NEOP|nr:unnamed protein product [Timema tahoe]
MLLLYNKILANNFKNHPTTTHIARKITPLPPKPRLTLPGQSLYLPPTATDSRCLDNHSTSPPPRLTHVVWTITLPPTATHVVWTITLPPTATHVVWTITLAPNVTHVAGTITLAPNVTHVAGTITLAPNVTHVAGTITLAPNATHVAGTITLAPNVTHVAGTITLPPHRDSRCWDQYPHLPTSGLPNVPPRLTFLLSLPTCV